MDLEPDVQHCRIKISENAKHEHQVEVSATSITGDKFVLREDRTDMERVTESTPLDQFVVAKFFAVHKLLEAGTTEKQ